jgi:hypothetical protein
MELIDATYYVVDGGPTLGLVPSAENTADLRSRHLGVRQRFRNRVPNQG